MEGVKTATASRLAAIELGKILELYENIYMEIH